MTEHLLRGAWWSVIRPLEAWGRLRPTDALVPGGVWWAAADAGLLPELASSLGRALRGRRLGLDVGGRRIRAELHSVWLDRRDMHFAGRLELRCVECEGLQIQRLLVAADTVALTSPPDMAIVTSGVELWGHTTLRRSSRGWTAGSPTGNCASSRVVSSRRSREAATGDSSSTASFTMESWKWRSVPSGGGA
jgi:hypothetical protein